MIAYFDCFSGISGDMTLGALLDLGVPEAYLTETLSTLPLSGFEISVSTVSRSGISANRVEVKVTDTPHPRDYTVIKSLIQESPLPESVIERSLEIFRRIAEAEADVHGCPVEKVHFHEVGGIDAIVDIVGTCLCLEYLGIDTVIASKIPLGSGLTSSMHGVLPVPAPATLAILKGVPVSGSEIEHELTTPTGAAIITALADSFETMPEMVVQKIGYGAGKREFGSRPNVLRVLTGKLEGISESRSKADNTGMERISVIETNIDDMNPEFYGFIMERLFEDGALDVVWLPVFMKKNRPGTMIQVLCHRQNRDDLVRRILSETTTSGLRYYTATRHILQRREVKVETVYGSLKAKEMTDPEGRKRVVPEYEECKRIAMQENIPVRVVYDTILKALHLNSYDKI